MTDPADHSGDPHAERRPDTGLDADGAPQPSLPPEFESALRDASTWKEPAPAPSLMSRALAEHNAELADARAARGWPRQWGLMAASVVLAGVGISIGVINTDRPSFRYVFAGGDSLNYSRAAGGGMKLATVEAAKQSGEQDTITEIQQQARQLAGDQSPLVQAREQNPTATTGTSDSPAPAGGAPSEPTPAVAVVPAAATPAASSRGLSKDAGGSGSPAASKTENAALDRRGDTNTTITNTNVADMGRASSGTNEFGQSLPESEVESAKPKGVGAPPAGALAPRSEAAQQPTVTKQLPTTKDWLRYGVRLALGGGPWIFLAGSLLAIIWIRRRP